MKKKYLQLSILMLLLSVFIFQGCVSINKYTNKTFSSSTDSEIEIYSNTKLPTRPYIEIGEIIRGSKNLYKLKKEATELGADAVIIVGPAYPAHNSILPITVIWRLKEKGWKAIAIKYIDNIVKNN
jgi:hypothetical protein